jgi:hypothetical protein
MITVCTSSTNADGAIVTTCQYRAVLGVTSTADDATQQVILARASRWVESQIGYPLLAQSYLETVPAYGGQNLVLSRTPVRCILRFFDSTSTDTATELCSTDYRLEDADAGFISRDAGFEWTAGERYYMGKTVVANSELRPWRIEYIAGWTTGMSTGDAFWTTCGGSTSTGPTIPADLEQAAILKAIEWVKSGPGAGIASESVGDLSVTYQSGTNARSEAADLCRPFRRLA